MSEILLEGGKTYRTRDGRKVQCITIVTHYQGEYAALCTVEGRNRYSLYCSDGRWAGGKDNDDWDIVAEWGGREMSKFNSGDKVFHVGHGAGEVTSIGNNLYCVTVLFENGGVSLFTEEGCYHEGHTIPQLLTLEEAEAKGYDVPKEKRKVKMAPALRYSPTIGHTITITLYPSEEVARKECDAVFVKWLGGTPYEIEVEIEED